MMKEELKQKWIEALESGKYLKGQFMLKSTRGKYCCLGVLSDIIGDERYNSESGVWTDGIPESSHSAYIPTDIGVELGITEDHQHEIASINDTAPTFGLAINYIREKL